MSETQLKVELSKAKVDAGRIAALMRENPDLIDSVFQELSNESARAKFGCSKSLMLASESDPDLLQSSTEKVFKLLDSGNQILKWNAIAILGNLTAADRTGRIVPALQRLYRFLLCGELITANHAIAALGKIGRAFPKERRKITGQLLQIERASFPTDECRNIALGKCIQAMAMFVDAESAPKEILEFARRQTGNRRRATAEKAKSFLRKIDG